MCWLRRSRVVTRGVAAEGRLDSYCGKSDLQLSSFIVIDIYIFIYLCNIPLHTFYWYASVARFVPCLHGSILYRHRA